MKYIFHGTQQMRNEIIYLISDSICSSDRHGSLLDHLLYIILILKMASVYFLCTLSKRMMFDLISLYPSQIFI